MEIEGIINTEQVKSRQTNDLKTNKENFQVDTNKLKKADGSTNTSSEKKSTQIRQQTSHDIHQNGFRFKVLDPNSDNAGKIVIEILNKEGKVIRTIPSEEVDSYMEGIKNTQLDAASFDVYA